MAAGVVWADKAAKVGRMGNRGRRAWNVEGLRSRHVNVRRSHKYHVGNSARERYQELAKLRVVRDKCREERLIL